MELSLKQAMHFCLKSYLSCRDAILVAIINCATSVFAGFVIFAVLGFMAHVTNQDVKDVATGGKSIS